MRDIMISQKIELMNSATHQSKFRFLANEMREYKGEMNYFKRKMYIL